MFRLDWKHWRWHSLDAPEEADFPLSDGTFAEVEK